jgi:signal transduction histidine kinase
LSVAWTFDPVERTSLLSSNLDTGAEKNVVKMKSEFVATVSHELRTPLAASKCSGLLRAAKVDRLPKGGAVRREAAATHRLAALVDDILDLAATALVTSSSSLSRTRQLLARRRTDVTVSQHNVELVFETPSGKFLQ